MRRDGGLCRTIMLMVADGKAGAVDVDDICRVTGYDARLVRYHCWLLVDGGYAEPALLADGESVEPDQELSSSAPRELTKLGRDFCDLARGEATWQEAKDFFPDGKYDFEWITEVLIQQRDQRSEQACSG
jgi:hypothetical protein